MEDNTDSSKALTKRPVIFGEVLFDSFPDGNSVLGGAPFNVAWHLKGFGLDPLFISRVGNDTNGNQVRHQMRSWGMDLSGLQQDQKHPTGQVTIALEEGQPTFTIIADQAYDYIEAVPAIAAIESNPPSLLYCGTLINRSEMSRTTLAQIKESAVPCYVDINLREPWWNESIIDQILQNARWAKLNDAEVELVTGCDDIVSGAMELLTQYSLEWIVVTRGSEGAFIAHANKIIEADPVRVNEVVDTVGAGDAFSAVTLFGIINGWPLPEIIQRAVRFAAEICKVRGATVNDQRFYDKFLRHWQNE